MKFFEKIKNLIKGNNRENSDTEKNLSVVQNDFSLGKNDTTDKDLEFKKYDSESEQSKNTVVENNLQVQPGITNIMPESEITKTEDKIRLLRETNQPVIKENKETITNYDNEFFVGTNDADKNRTITINIIKDFGKKTQEGNLTCENFKEISNKLDHHVITEKNNQVQVISHTVKNTSIDEKKVTPSEDKKPAFTLKNNNKSKKNIDNTCDIYNKGTLIEKHDKNSENDFFECFVNENLTKFHKDFCLSLISKENRYSEKNIAEQLEKEVKVFLKNHNIDYKKNKENVRKKIEIPILKNLNSWQVRNLKKLLRDDEVENGDLCGIIDFDPGFSISKTVKEIIDYSIEKNIYVTNEKARQILSFYYWTYEVYIIDSEDCLKAYQNIIRFISIVELRFWREKMQDIEKLIDKMIKWFEQCYIDIDETSLFVKAFFISVKFSNLLKRYPELEENAKKSCYSKEFNESYVKKIIESKTSVNNIVLNTDLVNKSLADSQQVEAKKLNKVTNDKVENLNKSNNSVKKIDPNFSEYKQESILKPKSINNIDDFLEEIGSSQKTLDSKNEIDFFTDSAETLRDLNEVFEHLNT